MGQRCNCKLARQTTKSISRRAIALGTAIAPLGQFLTLQTPAIAKQLEAPAPRPAYSFELSFSYRPVNQDGLAGVQRVRAVSIPVDIFNPGAQTQGQGSGQPPVVLFSSGFLQPATSYRSFTEELLAAGFAVVRYDKSFETLSTLVDDVDSTRLLQQVQQEAAARLDWPVGSQRWFLAGHSRGAKLSVLAAAGESSEEPLLPSNPAEDPSGASRATAVPLIAGLILLDPADGSFEPQDPARYPSALGALRMGQQPNILTALPVLVVGAGRGGDCVPRGKNYRAFYDAWPGPRALVTLRDAGHLQFLDPSSSDSLRMALCAAGPRGVRNEEVARASGRLADAFAGLCVPASLSQQQQQQQHQEERALSTGVNLNAEGCGAGVLTPAVEPERLRAVCEAVLKDVGLRYEVEVSV